VNAIENLGDTGAPDDIGKEDRAAGRAGRSQEMPAGLVAYQSAPTSTGYSVLNRPRRHGVETRKVNRSTDEPEHQHPST